MRRRLLLMVLGKFPSTGSKLRRFAVLGVAIIVRLLGFLSVGRKGGGSMFESIATEGGGFISREMLVGGVGVPGHTWGLEMLRREVASARESPALYEDVTAGSGMFP